MKASLITCVCGFMMGLSACAAQPTIQEPSNSATVALVPPRCANVAAVNAINQLAAAHPAFGAPTTNVLAAADGRGCYREYANTASIFYNPTRQLAYSTFGSIRDKHRAMGGASSSLGYPIGEIAYSPDDLLNRRLSDYDGRQQAFERGTIFYSPDSGAIAVTSGSLLSDYAAEGHARRIGFPVTELQRTGNDAMATTYYQTERGYLVGNTFGGPWTDYTGYNGDGLMAGAVDLYSDTNRRGTTRQWFLNTGAPFVTPTALADAALTAKVSSARFDGLSPAQSLVFYNEGAALLNNASAVSVSGRANLGTVMLNDFGANMDNKASTVVAINNGYGSLRFSKDFIKSELEAAVLGAISEEYRPFMVFTSTVTSHPIQRTMTITMEAHCRTPQTGDTSLEQIFDVAFAAINHFSLRIVVRPHLVVRQNVQTIELEILEHQAVFLGRAEANDGLSGILLNELLPRALRAAEGRLNWMAAQAAATVSSFVNSYMSFYRVLLGITYPGDANASLRSLLAILKETEIRDKVGVRRINLLPRGLEVVLADSQETSATLAAHANEFVVHGTQLLSTDRVDGAVYSDLAGLGGILANLDRGPIVFLP